MTRCRPRPSSPPAATTTTSASTPGAASGVPPPPAGTVGLRHWTVVLDGASTVTATRERLAAAGVTVVERDGGILVHDPAGIPVLIAPDAR